MSTSLAFSNLPKINGPQSAGRFLDIRYATKDGRCVVILGEKKWEIEPHSNEKALSSLVEKVKEAVGLEGIGALVSNLSKHSNTLKLNRDRAKKKAAMGDSLKEILYRWAYNFFELVSAKFYRCFNVEYTVQEYKSEAEKNFENRSNEYDAMLLLYNRLDKCKCEEAPKESENDINDEINYDVDDGISSDEEAPKESENDINDEVNYDGDDETSDIDSDEKGFVSRLLKEHNVDFVANLPEIECILKDFNIDQYNVELERDGKDIMNDLKAYYVEPEESCD